MADRTQKGGIEFGGLQGWIVRVLCQRPVAGLAIQERVLALRLLIQDIRVAGFAALVAGEVNRPGGEVGQGLAAIVPVLSETLGDQKPPNGQEQRQTDKKDSSQSKKMSCILEGVHAMLAG